jgi:oligopeptidase B
MAPRGVIINGYGAYNIPTNLNTTRWKPYLDHGVAIGFAMPRGGGDYNDMWAEAGRVHRKYKSVEDFEACVRAIRGALGLGADKTVVFGRSAGGYLVGAATARNPEGKLFGTVYTEVPYVDVLKTASNQQLPLTKYEYLEFGDPLHVIADFETMLRLGPVSALDEKGAPGVYVICRTAVNDRQVYAYESVKWMDALRGKGGKDKLLAITGGQGHFTRGNQLYGERAADYLLLKRIFG